MINLDRIFFLTSYGILGVLPLAQLKIAWLVLSPSQIGTLFFMSALSLLIASLCDANVNFRSISKVDPINLELEIQEALRLRITRFMLFVPIAVLFSILFKFDMYILASTFLIVFAKLLSISYIYRNSGSVYFSVKWELQLRFLTLFLPILTLWFFDLQIGLLIGCLAVFLTQIFLIIFLFGNKVLPTKLSIENSLDINLISAFIGVGYSNFSQVAAGFLLSSNTYAVFASFDKLVRSCLLIVEPTRLLVLRETGMKIKNDTLKLSFFGVFLSLFCCALIFILFNSGLSNLIFDMSLDQGFFIIVAATTSFVSFITVCIFIQQGFVKIMSYGLTIGILVGILLFYLSVSLNIYLAVIMFEISVSIFLFFTLFFIPKQNSKVKQ